MTIKAWQHIYTNVERDQSPNNRSGFQTLFYSKEGLNPNEVAEIEERVFYVYGSHNPVKHVFFRLTSNKIAIGRVGTIAGRDGAGREGLYIAHTLVFDVDVFLSATFTPAQLFESDLFAVSIEEAFSLGERDGNIKQVQVKIAESHAAGISWPADTFRKLVQLAINNKALAGKKSAVALTGNPQAIHNTLAGVFTVLPREILADCSFDTFFERGGNLRFTHCWAAGFSERPRQPVYIFADVDQQHIPKPADFAEAFVQPMSAFGRWIDQKMSAGLPGDTLSSIIRQKETALLISKFIEGQHRDVESVLATDESLVVEVAEANESLVKDRILNQIDAVCPSPLAGRILDEWYPNQLISQRIRAMVQPLEAEALLPYLFAAYERAGFTSPEKEERQALADMLQNNNHAGLEGLLLIWGGGSWSNPVKSWRIKSAVEDMDVETYRNFWHLAVPHKLVDELDLLVKGKEAIFTNLLAETGIKDLDELPKIIKTLVGAQSLEALDVLAPYLVQLDKGKLKKVRKYTRGLAGIPPGFQQALDALPG